MAEYKRLGDYVLFEREFESSLFSSWRAGEVIGGMVEEHLRIDILSPDLCKNASLAEHWLGHTVSAAKLDHPNLLKERTAVIDGNLIAIYPYQESYSMEQLFQKSISEGIPFSVDHALLIAGKMASALSFASKAHQPHALVLPAFINVSAEGDLKLRGCAISHSLREHLSAHPELMESYGRYFPQTDHLGDGGLERYAVFAVGALLFEMLTGESFYLPGKVLDARMRVSETEAPSSDGPIPDEVANVLCKSIDPHIPKAYENTQALNMDMEKLLFSGEYSPTTFNLAFFMHSAFRDEVEKRVNAMNYEKTVDFGISSSTPPPIVKPVPPQGTLPGTEGTPTGISKITGYESAGKSNKTGLIAGIIVAAVVVLAIGGYFIFSKKDDDSDQKRLAQQQALLEMSKESKKASETLQDNRKDVEIQILREQLQKQMDEMMKENTRLDDEMKAAESVVDERASDLAKKYEAERKASEEKLAALEAELERVQKEKDAEAERARQVAEAARLKKESETPPPIEELPADKPNEQPDDTSQITNTVDSGVPVPVPVGKTSEPVVESKPKPAVNSAILPHSMMDNAEDLESPLNGQNFYTPARKALTAGILKSGKYYAYTFNVVIDEEGNTAECHLDQNPFANLQDDFGMANRAMEWAQRLRYKPPLKNGLPSKCRKLVLIHFKVL